MKIKTYVILLIIGTLSNITAMNPPATLTHDQAVKLAEHSKTISAMLKDFPKIQQTIPLPLVDKKSLEFINALLNNCKIKTTSNEESLNLSQAINFLDIPELEHVQNTIVQHFSNLVFGKNFEKVNLENLQSKIMAFPKRIPEDIKNRLLKQLIMKRKSALFDVYKLSNNKTYNNNVSQYLITSQYISGNAIWDAKSEKKLFNLPNINGADIPAFSPDDTKLAIESKSDNTITIFDANSGKVLQTLQEPQDFHRYDNPLEDLASLQFSPDGNKLAKIFNLRGKIIIWDIKQGKQLRTINHINGIRTLIFNPQGTQVAIISSNSEVIVWNIQENSKLQKYKNKQALAFNQDGTKILLIPTSPTIQKLNSDGTKMASIIQSLNALTIQDAQTNKVMHILPINSKEIGSFTFSPDGTKVNIKSSDLKTMKVYDIRTFKTWQESLKALLEAKEKIKQ